MRLGFTGVFAVAALLLGGGILLYLYVNRKGIINAVNPFSQTNVANKTVSAAVQGITGGAASGGEDSLGGVFARIREYVSGDDAKINAMKQGGVSTVPAEQQVKPVSNDVADGVFYP